ncbi:MAG TPA: two-component regulator propeller domain-containing protein, partial [Ferruginibacter sp.]|nr:two-component regulator propeller domain-containing protein [Ferruginibacter sp.]
MRLFIYLVILVIFFCSNVIAQPQQYLFSFMGTKDGLEEEFVLGVQQDTKGYIWIATHNALQRFDGQRFMNLYHKENDAHSIPGSGIKSIMIDKKNRLWILAGPSNLGYLDVDNLKYTPVKVQPAPSIDLDKSASSLYVDKDGNVLLIFPGKTFMTFNETAGEVAEKYNPFKLPAGWGPLYLWQDQNRNYWVGAENGLLKYNPVNKKTSYRDHNEDNDPFIKNFQESRTVFNAFVDKTQRMWLLTWHGGRLSIKSYSAVTGEEEDWANKISTSLKNIYYELQGITELKDGSIWMSGFNIFAKLNRSTESLEPIENDVSEYSIHFDQICNVYEDRENNVWVSTNKGLFRFNPTAQLFKVINNRLPGRDTIYTPDVNDFLQTPDGEIMVGTWGNGIFSYNNNLNPVSSKYISRISPPGEAMVWCMTRKTNGDIWRGVQAGYIFIYKAATGKTIRLHPPVFENSTIRQIVEDKNGDIWIGSQRGYLVKYG